MGTIRSKKLQKVKDRLASSFLISEPFTWNKKQVEIIDQMISPKSKCIIIDSLAGTGKTIMSTFAALSLVQKKQYFKIYYVRSAVESASSKLQALPGSWEEKIAVYGGPLLDALNKLLNPEEIHAFFAAKRIEIVPVSYLRGRSFDNSVIIVDEAQNFTLNEIITIMTRLEETSKMFIIADSDQCDLPKHLHTEFKKLIDLFNNEDSVEHNIHYFEMKDPEYVMRSEFVKFISNRYSKYLQIIK